MMQEEESPPPGEEESPWLYNAFSQSLLHTTTHLYRAGHFLKRTTNTFVKKSQKPVEAFVSLYEFRWPNWLRWRGSVTPHILHKVLLCTAFAILVTCLDSLLDIDLGINTAIISVLNLVIGLLLVFRTNTAYDRFYEGRILWTTLLANVRNLSRYFWVGIKAHNDHDYLLKENACKLLMAFAISVKHYLRQEYGCDWEDLYPLLAHIPQYTLPSAVEPFRMPEKVATTTTHSSKTAKSQSSKEKAIEGIKLATTNNIPLEILIHIYSFVVYARDNGDFPPPLGMAMNLQLLSLSNTLSGLERVLRTPIPLAYGIHLSQALWVFCLAIPFQLVNTAGWTTIVFSALICYVMMGIESIGGQIENPFGYDDNDLPLDLMCKVLCDEIEFLIDKHPRDVDDWANDLTMKTGNSEFTRIGTSLPKDIAQFGFLLDDAKTLVISEPGPSRSS